jgi:predicted ribosome quality control (RQC) complex YloA/Tae2 family protein
MDYKKVEGHPGLIRDLESNAVINNDKSAYQNYIQLREQKLKEKERLDKLENEVGEIKSLLQKLVDKL